MIHGFQGRNIPEAGPVSSVSRGLIMTHTPGLAFSNRLKSICQRGHYSRLARREYLPSPDAAKYKFSRKTSGGILFIVFAIIHTVVAGTLCRRFDDSELIILERFDRTIGCKYSSELLSMQVQVQLLFSFLVLCLKRV